MSNRGTWLLWAAVLPGILGCQGAFGPTRLPEDPLLVSRVPRESRAVFAPPAAAPSLEVAAPRNHLVGPNYADRESRIVPGILTNRWTQGERDIDDED